MKIKNNMLAERYSDEEHRGLVHMYVCIFNLIIFWPTVKKKKKCLYTPTVFLNNFIHI